MKNPLLIIPLFIIQLSFAQNNKQKIRGAITDKLSQTTLPGAAVQIINRADRKGTTSDEEGNYTLSDLSPDRYELKISYLGYKDVLVPNVVGGHDLSSKIGIIGLKHFKQLNNKSQKCFFTKL